MVSKAASGPVSNTPAALASSGAVKYLKTMLTGA